MPEFRPFNYAQSVGAGTQNALMQMQAMQAANQIKQAPEERNYLLKQRENASADRKNALQSMALDRAMKGYTLLERGAKSVLGAGGKGYDAFAKKMTELGVAKPGELPAQYDADFIKGLAGYAKKQLDSFGQPKAGVDEQGREVFFQTDKEGNKRVVEGIRPPKKGAGITTTLPDGTVIQVGGDMPKPVKKKLTEDTISAGERLARLKRIKKNYDPSFLTYQGRAKNIWSQLKSKADVELTQEERQALRQRRRFTQAVNFEFNAYRKQITGAAAAVKELEDLKKAMINTDLSPDEFEAAFNEYSRELSRTVRIRNKLLREGLQPGTKQFGQALDGLYLSGEDDSVDARGDELMKDGLDPEAIVDRLEEEGYL